MIRIASSSFDLVVVGGGVYGAWAALDASRRGLRVALVERGDWASGTSSASSKLVHGGLRYLERLELSLVRSALRERRALVRIAPHLVHPLRFVIPRRRGDRVSALKLRAGLFLYDVLAGRDRAVPAIENVGAAAARERWPWLAGGVRGAFCYPDCVTDDARLVLEVVLAARGAGAEAASYTEAVEVSHGPGGVEGVRLRDVETGATRDVEARAVIAAVGPWIGGLPGVDAPPVRLVRGAHVVLPSPGADDAVLTFARDDGRVAFLIPWYGATLVGTTEVDVPDIGAAGAAEPSDAEVDYLLRVADDVTGRGWTRADVRGAFAGVRTLAGRGAGSATRASRELEVARPAPGLFCPVGGKLTTARADAAALVDEVGRLLGRELPRAPEPALRDERTPRLEALVRERPELAEPLADGLPFTGAHAVDAVLHEDARRLEDVVRRRMPLVLLTRDREAARERVHELIAPFI